MKFSQQRESFGWTSLEPDTPPISPPHQSLPLPVRQIHHSFLSKLEDHHQAGAGCSALKCEDISPSPMRDIQVSLCIIKQISIILTSYKHRRTFIFTKRKIISESEDLHWGGRPGGSQRALQGPETRHGDEHPLHCGRNNKQTDGGV